MNTIQRLFIAVTAVLAMAAATPVFADPVTDNVVGAAGYDLTSYFTQERPQRGNGHHIVVVDKVTYLFATDANKKAFEAEPAKYLPQYGGYCAYGASVGKKFSADPEQFDIVDGKLYLNLDSKIRAIWSQNIPGRISDGNKHWKTIVNTPASQL